MADFRTHAIGAAVPSVVLSAWLVHDQGLSLPIAAACMISGAGGGLLPDIDSESSISMRLIFSIVAVLSAALGANVVYVQAAQVELAYRVLAALGAAAPIFLIVRYGVSKLFLELSSHRGVIHSVPMATAFGLALVHTAMRWLGLPLDTAMWPGIFLSGGFLIHLLLDEAFSVDLAGKRLKRSFGTAMKLGSRSNLLGTAGLYLANLALILALPGA